jgi:hypothetical protein
MLAMSDRFHWARLLAVIGQIDRSDPAQDDGFSAAVRDPGTKPPEVGGITAPGGGGEIRRLETTGEIPEHAIPLDGRATLYYTYSQSSG